MGIIKTSSKSVLLYALAAVNFTHIVDFMIIMPLGDRLMKEFAISPAEFSIIVSVYTLSAGIISFLSAFYIDRFPRKAALLFTYAGFILATALITFADSYAFIIVSRSVAGMFGGVMGSLVLSVVSDMYSFKERGKAMGVVSAAFALASVVGVPSGLYLANHFDWHVPFMALVGTSILVWLILLRIMPRTPSVEAASEITTRERPLEKLSKIYADKNQLRALGVGFFIVMGQFMIIPFIAPSMIRNVGLNEDTIALMYLLGGGTVIFTSQIIGRLTDRFGATRIFITFALLSFAGILVFTSLGPTPMWVALVVTTLLFVFVNGRMIPAQTITTSAVGPETRASFMSFKSSLQQLAAALASMVSGFIIVEAADGSLDNYLYAGLLSVAITGVSLWLLPKLKVAAGND